MIEADSRKNSVEIGAEQGCRPITISAGPDAEKCFLSYIFGFSRIANEAVSSIPRHGLISQHQLLKRAQSTAACGEHQLFVAGCTFQVLARGEVHRKHATH